MVTLVRNVIVPSFGGDKTCFVSFDNNIILGMGLDECADALRADEIVDAHGATLIPGLIDSHVHFREPGLTHKATIKSESLAARAGGITTVFDMPNSSPATTTAAALADKLAIGRRDSAVHYYAFFGAVPGGFDELKKIDPATIPGVKIFLGTSTGSMQAPDARELNEIFHYCSHHGLPVVVHAEDNAVIAANTAEAIARYGSAEAVPVSEHHLIRSREACVRATEAAVEMALATKTRLHLAHISTADELQFLTEGDPGTKLITAETTPMYLDPWIADEQHRTSRHKINPAVKTVADAEAIRLAVLDGRIDTIATDHAPHLLNEKQGGALSAASGAPSVQFALPMLLEVLPLDTVVARMAQAPAEIFSTLHYGEAYGKLRPGHAADLVLVEKVTPYIITDADVLSPCGWTPFDGRTASHRVVRTWVSGR